MKSYTVIYKVHNIPGRDNGFDEYFEFLSDTENVEDEVLEHLGEYFYAGNFSILSIEETR